MREGGRVKNGRGRVGQRRRKKGGRGGITLPLENTVRKYAGNAETGPRGENPPVKFRYRLQNRIV
ncbi:hypothetical protein K0M31_007272 [Melipona bicolor]|uniref:Uncharacterized protein n=1 Tax=Melipona bicolor TaxID=60889 RepID=A0AA40KVI6_9HYME|nr:hypothetical protein K0M31_007272 [Melipona bicolor]